MTGDNEALLKPHDMEADGIPDAHVSGIDMSYRASSLTAEQAARLPQPVLVDGQDWIDLYWRTWAIGFDRVRTPDPKTGFKSFCDAAFSENMFQWDTCFLIGFVRYAMGVLPVYNTLDNFYFKQHDDGFICREISSVTAKDFWPKRHPSGVNPPLYSNAEWLLYEISGDSDRLAHVYPSLARYHAWLRSNRRHADGIGYWTTALASGMDNTPRAFLKGGADADKDYGFSWMCLTAQQALSLQHLSDIADVIGRPDEAAEHAAERDALLAYIDQNYWSDTLGFYVDQDADGELTDVLTPAGLWPILAGAGTPERHERVFAALEDPEKFWRPHAIPSVSADHPTYHHSGNYWQGSVWPPMVMLAVRAAQNTGRSSLARKITENHLRNLTEVYAETGTLWENYAPEYPRRGNVSRPEFVGWSGCGPIEAFLEAIIGIRLNAASNTVRWVSSREDKHGIKNLKMGKATLSLVCDPANQTIAYATDAPFRLSFERNGSSQVLTVPKGKGTLELGAS